MDKRGLDYLNNRFVTQPEIIDFGIAYCDNFLKLSSFGDIHFDIVQSKFKDSVIIPVFNVYNNLLGVYSRRLVPGNYAKIDGSSWDKKNHLFGLNKSWKYCLDSDTVFVVEGPFDMIACWKHGYKNCVSLMGTTFSFEQMCLLYRFCRNIVLVFDGDQVGIDKSKKAEVDLKSFGFNCSRIELEGDPDVELERNPKILG